ncbi:MAG: VOC family protein [Bacteroidota bacterium]
MTTVNVYITFPGNCKEAFDFYKSVFGGEYPYVGTFSEMPPQDGIPPISDSDKDKIMHMSLPISNETILMGSDTVEGFGDPPVVGNNFSISVSTDSKEEADRIFGELSVGGNVVMPMADTFWGSYFGMFTDKFGINWMVGHDDQPQ